MDESSETCLELDLGLGLSEYGPKRDIQLANRKRRVLLDLSISHLPNDHITNSSSNLKIDVGEEEKRGFKNGISSDFRKDEDDRGFTNNYSRKKLRLTRDQTILLEDSFKQHCTLNMTQKQALAEQLKLKPRQVEVWFQNRRARTKLKQTELNFQFLEKNCERLSEENRRLKKELLELKSSATTEKMPLPAQLSPPFLHCFPEAAAAALRKCESCEEIDKDRSGSGGKQDAVAADKLNN